MDDFNNNNNFGEESFAEKEMQNEASAQNAEVQQNPYAQPEQNPYNQSAEPYNQPASNPFNQQNADPYNQPSSNPYNQQSANPYNLPNSNPYNQPNSNPYNQQNVSPYNQPNSNPYNQQNAGAYNQGGNTYNMPGAYQNNYSVPPQQGSYNNAQQSAYDPYKQPYDPYKQPYAYNQYGGYQNGTYPTGMAVASLIIGIMSILLMFFMLAFPVLGILPIIGIVLGVVYKSKHYPVGKGLSTAGIVTSAVSIGLVLLIFVGLVIWMMTLMMGDGSEMQQLMQYVKNLSPEVYEEYYNQFYNDYPQWFEGISALFASIFKR
ncbi:MAG: hypothetical protein ACI4RG_04895 [Huintestinicola sp.]